MQRGNWVGLLLISGLFSIATAATLGDALSFDFQVSFGNQNHNATSSRLRNLPQLLGTFYDDRFPNTLTTDISSFGKTIDYKTTLYYRGQIGFRNWWVSYQFAKFAWRAIGSDGRVSGHIGDRAGGYELGYQFSQRTSYYFRYQEYSSSPSMSPLQDLSMLGVGLKRGIQAHLMGKLLTVNGVLDIALFPYAQMNFRFAKLDTIIEAYPYYVVSKKVIEKYGTVFSVTPEIRIQVWRIPLYAYFSYNWEMLMAPTAKFTESHRRMIMGIATRFNLSARLWGK